MTEQIKALQLAQELDAYHTRSCHKEAAAELRRQHEENERLFKLAEDQDSVIRRQRAERQELEAQRNALLEALEKMVAVYSGQVQNDGGYTVLDSVRPLITDQAAIEAAGMNT